MKNIIEKILDKNNQDNIIFKSNGEEAIFEQVAVVDLDTELFAILHPLGEGIEDNEVMVFRVMLNDNEASLELEEDESIVEEVFDEYDKLNKKA